MVNGIAFVQPAKNEDGWEVRRAGSDRAAYTSNEGETKREFIKRVKDYAEKNNLQLQPRKLDGEFEDADYTPDEPNGIKG